MLTLASNELSEKVAADTFSDNLGKFMKNEIENLISHLTNNIVDSNSFTQKVVSGQLGPQHLTGYLSDLQWLFKQHVKYAASARSRAKELGDLALSDFFNQKVKEEVGHHRWAENDIVANGLRKIDQPSSAARDMIEFVDSTVHQDPLLFVAYIVWIETFTVIAGNRLRPFLEANRLNEANLSSVYMHVEADSLHSVEGIEFADAKLAKDPGLAEVFLNKIRESANLTSRFLSLHAAAN